MGGAIDTATRHHIYPKSYFEPLYSLEQIPYLRTFGSSWVAQFRGVVRRANLQCACKASAARLQPKPLPVQGQRSLDHLQGEAPAPRKKLHIRSQFVCLFLDLDAKRHSLIEPGATPALHPPAPNKDQIRFHEVIATGGLLWKNLSDRSKAVRRDPQSHHLLNPGSPAKGPSQSPCRRRSENANPEVQVWPVPGKEGPLGFLMGP